MFYLAVTNITVKLNTLEVKSCSNEIGYKCLSEYISGFECSLSSTTGQTNLVCKDTIVRQPGERNQSSLRMSNVEELLTISDVQNVIQHGGKIIVCHRIPTA